MESEDDNKPLDPNLMDDVEEASPDIDTEEADLI